MVRRKQWSLVNLVAEVVMVWYIHGEKEAYATNVEDTILCVNG